MLTEAHMSVIPYAHPSCACISYGVVSVTDCSVNLQEEFVTDDHAEASGATDDVTDDVIHDVKLAQRDLQVQVLPHVLCKTQHIVLSMIGTDHTPLSKTFRTIHHGCKDSNSRIDLIRLSR